MTDMSIPAPVAETGGTDSAASQVTTQTTPDTVAVTPQAATPPDGTPQAETPDGEEQRKKTREEKQRERNRERWQKIKLASNPQRLSALEREVQALRELARPPDLTQVSDPAEELALRTAHKVQEAQAAQAQRSYAEEQQAAAAEFDRTIKSAWSEIVSEARNDIPDFDRVVTEKTPIHARAALPILESENPAQIAYYLGKNEAEARALYDAFESNPYRAMKLLGQIEAKISSAPKTSTNAPKPAKMVSGGSSPVAKSPEEMTFKEYEAWRAGKK